MHDQPHTLADTVQAGGEGLHQADDGISGKGPTAVDVSAELQIDAGRGKGSPRPVRRQRRDIDVPGTAPRPLWIGGMSLQSFSADEVGHTGQQRAMRGTGVSAAPDRHEEDEEQEAHNLSGG